jgi:hypothetical protein
MDVTVDLPTPPLPDTTAITFLTLAFSFSLASRLSFLRSPQSALLQLLQFPLQELIYATLLVLISYGSIPHCFTKIYPKNAPNPSPFGTGVCLL